MCHGLHINQVVSREANECAGFAGGAEVEDELHVLMSAPRMKNSRVLLISRLGRPCVVVWNPFM
jgi:hypothetical protein